MGREAAMERGRVLQKTEEGWIVASYDREGIVTPPLPSLHDIAYTAGDAVYFFLFSDGTGAIVNKLEPEHPEGEGGADGKDGEDAVLLYIDSSRGTMFKHNAVNTRLTVVLYKGSLRITDEAGLRAAFGVGAYLQWSWQRLDEDRYGIISADDSRLSMGGFCFTLSPADVDVKVNFRCELMTP